MLYGHRCVCDHTLIRMFVINKDGSHQGFAPANTGGDPDPLGGGLT